MWVWKDKGIDKSWWWIGIWMGSMIFQVRQAPPLFVGIRQSLSRISPSSVEHIAIYWDNQHLIFRKAQHQIEVSMWSQGVLGETTYCGQSAGDKVHSLQNNVQKALIPSYIVRSWLAKWAYLWQVNTFYSAIHHFSFLKKVNSYFVLATTRTDIQRTGLLGDLLPMGMDVGVQVLHSFFNGKTFYIELAPLSYLNLIEKRKIQPRKGSHLEQFGRANKKWVQVWNTVEVDAMIADNSSGFGRMSGLVADKAGCMYSLLLIDVFVFVLDDWSCGG